MLKKIKDAFVKFVKAMFQPKKLNKKAFSFPLVLPVLTVVDDVIDVVTEWLVAFWALIIQSIDLAVGLVYDPSGATLAERITFIGYLALFGLGIGIVKLGMGFVMRFFKK